MAGNRKRKLGLSLLADKTRATSTFRRRAATVDEGIDTSTCCPHPSMPHAREKTQRFVITPKPVNLRKLRSQHGFRSSGLGTDIQDFVKSFLLAATGGFAGLRHADGKGIQTGLHLRNL